MFASPSFLRCNDSETCIKKELSRRKSSRWLRPPAGSLYNKVLPLSSSFPAKQLVKRLYCAALSHTSAWTQVCCSVCWVAVNGLQGRRPPCWGIRPGALITASHSLEGKLHTAAAAAAAFKSDSPGKYRNTRLFFVFEASARLNENARFARCLFKW